MISDGIKIASIAIYCTPRKLSIFMARPSSKQSGWVFSFFLFKVIGNFFSQSFSHALLFLTRRQWHPTPVFLPGKSHGQRSLVGCHLWGRIESDTTEATQQQQQQQSDIFISQAAGGNKLAIFFPSLYKFKRRFLLKYCVAIMTPGFA